MQTTYAQKNEIAQRAADNTAAAVHDNSPQSVSLQRHASLANAAVQRAENPPRPNNTGLPDDLKNGIESLSGYSLDNVRVHYNSPKPATVQALAYTQGTDIHVAAGQEHALPHEAWHVAQQMAGRVTPTTNIGGMPVNDNAALEHEADVMGEKAVTQRMVDGSASSLKSVDLNGGSVQRIRLCDTQSLCTDRLYQIDCKTLKDIFDNFLNDYAYLENGVRFDVNALRKCWNDRKFDKTVLENIDVSNAEKQEDIKKIIKNYSISSTQTNEPACEVVTYANRATFDYKKYFTAESADWLKDNNGNLIENAQINSMIANNRQGPFNAGSIGLVYHIEGPYPSCGKPLWQIEEGKVKILGMYHHPDHDYKTYKCDKKIEGNGNDIKIS